jgi:hypothetical protein
MLLPATTRLSHPQPGDPTVGRGETNGVGVLDEADVAAASNPSSGHGLNGS